jgi:hypothetical protein
MARSSGIGPFAKAAAPLKRYPTIAPCGLDCGLCPRYYTAGKSRCPGCCGPDFASKHPSCSFITCCVKKQRLETCGECPEFPCAKFKSVEEYRAAESSSYPPARKMLPNLHFIRRHGLAGFLRDQRRRIRVLEAMLEDFDDGRSRSFYCRVAALLEPSDVKAALQRARRETEATGFPRQDPKARAKLLRGLLDVRADP